MPIMIERRFFNGLAMHALKYLIGFIGADDGSP
jgi:hypothetical protein